MLNSTVYVVDDNESARSSLTWLAESVGLKVEAFDSAQAFLDAFSPNMSGCLVLDVRMPGMGGLELQDRLEALNCTLPIIFISAFGELPTAVRAMKNGAVDFIEKPYDGQALLERVQRAVRDHSAVASVHGRIAELTQREKEVLDLVADGLSSRAIADKLGLSHKTVEAHRSKIMKKMQVSSVSELVGIYAPIRKTAEAS